MIDFIELILLIMIAVNIGNIHRKLDEIIKRLGRK